MRILEIINESFPVAKKTFVDQGASPEEVKAYFDKYKSLKDKNIIPTDHAKDIVQWTRSGWNEFKDHVDHWEHAPSKKSLKSAPKPDDNETIVLHEDDNWLVVIPLSHKSSCFHGRKSSWCTTKPLQSQYSDYVLDKNVTLIYALHKTNGGMYAIAYHNDRDEIEMFDKNDKSINENEFNSATGFNPNDLISKAKQHNDTINQGRETTKTTDPVYLAKQAIKTNKRNLEAEKYIVKHPIAGEYAAEVLKQRWPQAERAIIQSPKAASAYAQHVIKGRWPEAEKIIMKDPRIAHRYAKQVIKGRFTEAEKIIMKDPDVAYMYARDIIKGRWPEAEKIIMSNPWLASAYAQHVIKGRFTEAEKVIMSNPNTAYTYAIHVIKGRWPEAEKIIMSNPWLAYSYARDIIKGRWPEAEKIIMKYPHSRKPYKQEFNIKD